MKSLLLLLLLALPAKASTINYSLLSGADLTVINGNSLSGDFNASYDTDYQRFALSGRLSDSSNIDVDGPLVSLYDANSNLEYQGEPQSLHITFYRPDDFAAHVYFFTDLMRCDWYFEPMVALQQSLALAVESPEPATWLMLGLGFFSPLIRLYNSE